MQQVASVKTRSALVIADDTDLFVLLLHFCYQSDIDVSVFMTPPVLGRSLLAINASVEKHQAVTPRLLAAHGPTSFETVASYFGIGMAVAFRVLWSAEYHLSYLGDPNISLSDVTSQATHFVLACYGQSQRQSMTEARQKMWSTEVARSTASAPKVACLPPTNEAYVEYVARAHLLATVWKNALDPHPPKMDPRRYGWSEEQDCKSLTTSTIPDNISLAPEK